MVKLARLWNLLIATGSIMWAAYYYNYMNLARDWNEVKPWWFPVAIRGHWTGSGTILYNNIDSNKVPL